MAYNSKAIKTDVNAKPIPQYYNPVTDEYEALQGTGGAARQVLYAPDGNPISVADNKLAVRAEELETKIEAVRVLLNALAGEDFATQTTLAQILAKLDGVIDGTTVNAKPIPQYYNPTIDEYEVLQGRNGAQRVELYDANGNPVDLAALIASVIAEIQKPVKLDGSTMEYYGKSTDTKPTSAKVGSTFFEIDTKTVYVWDGTNWVVI